jgi:hypothetical protein
MKLVTALAPLLFAGLSMQAQRQASSPELRWAGPPVVKDAPYFADIISTYDRTTPSGERLHREMRSKIYRDTQGRTRREVEQITPSTGQKRVSVLIMDPISNTVISLDPQTTTAHVRDGSIITPPKQTVRSGPESLTAPPVASSGAAERAASTEEAKVEELGTQVIEGLTVKGTKITTPLAPAAGGNKQPRLLITSTWVSEELHIDVLTEIDDVPENHRTIRLVNIVRTEPESWLFEIPSGYAVVDSRSKE